MPMRRSLDPESQRPGGDEGSRLVADDSFSMDETCGGGGSGEPKYYAAFSGPWWTQIGQEAWDRGRWLVVLLVLQSMSSFVLSSYEALVKEHMVVTLFLTMLVGAGGNCGVQSAVKVIRGMALGQVRSLGPAIVEQGAVGLVLGGVMAIAAWFRVWVFGLGSRNATAISLSCFMIVTMSVLAGTVLPFALRTVGLDPGHAGAAVQVVMDVMGCLITCAICSMVLSVTSTLTGAEILQTNSMGPI